MNPVLKKIISRFLWTVIGFLGVILIFLIAVFSYWYIRPNSPDLRSSLELEKLSEVRYGRHNAVTDLIQWKGSYYLTFREANTHFASKKSKVRILRSSDARSWEDIKTLQMDVDIRDPKFAVIRDRLYVYVLENIVWSAAPYRTCFSSTEDGKQWSELAPVEPDGWIFWRPKTRDQETWYVPAYWGKLGKAILLKSQDGFQWTVVSTIYEGDKINETAIEFLSDGRLLSVGRLEGKASNFGDNESCTLIAVSEFPYTDWTYQRSKTTRLDSPCLFSYRNHIFALGRYQSHVDNLIHKQGSVFGKKRTSLFHVTEKELHHLVDLPSSGDTAYGGIAIQDDEAVFAYYTNAVNREYPWFMGMFGKCSILVHRLKLKHLVAYANLE